MADIYVDFTNGNDGTGDGSSGNPYKTFKKGIDTISAAGDKVYYCTGGGSDEQLSARPELSGVDGTYASPIEIIGTNDSFVEDGTRPVLDGNSAVNQCLLVTNSDFVHVKNFEMKNADYNGVNFYNGSQHGYCYNVYAHNHGNNGFEISNTGANEFCIFDSCHSYSNTNDGFELTKQACIVYNCKSYSNGDSGVVTDIDSYGCKVIMSEIYSNGSHGVEAATSCDVIDCILRDNTSNGADLAAYPSQFTGNIVHNNTIGINISATYSNGTIYSNTIDSNSGDGINLTGAELIFVKYNRITNNGGYGVDVAGGYVAGIDNYFYNNTSGETNGNYTEYGTDVSMAGDGYNDDANDDFNLTSDAEGRSVTIDIDGTNISYVAAGALNPEATGGGRRPRARYIGV